MSRSKITDMTTRVLHGQKQRKDMTTRILHGQKHKQRHDHKSITWAEAKINYYRSIACAEAKTNYYRSIAWTEAKTKTKNTKT